jgi:hypothetical protein
MALAERIMSSNGAHAIERPAAVSLGMGGLREKSMFSWHMKLQSAA